MKTEHSCEMSWRSAMRGCGKSGRRFVRWGLISIAACGLACMLLVPPTPVDAQLGIEVRTLRSLPNHDFIPEIERLCDAGSLQEALELVRFVRANPELPSQEVATRLEAEIDQELHSVMGHGKRVVSGFVTGEGNSVDEIGGAIASDMILYGDVRDLCKQGYRHVRGRETDGLIVSLAAIGLLTEVIDIADWGPAVLKALRKANSLTKRFADWTITACRRSIKTRKLEPSLRVAMANLNDMIKKLGLGRTAAITRHVNTADDLAVVAKAARRSPDATYLMVKLGGGEGVDFLRTAGRTAAGMDTLKVAAKKGPAGLDWIRRNGLVRRLVITTRIGARTAKNFRLGRPQKLFHHGIDAASKRYPWVVGAVAWGGPVAAVAALFSLFMALLHLVHIPAVFLGRVTRRRQRTSMETPGGYSKRHLVPQTEKAMR